MPQFIASLSSPLATQLQLYTLTRPELSLSEVIRTAISLEPSTTTSSSRANVFHDAASNLQSAARRQDDSPSLSTSSSTGSQAANTRQRPYCSYHGPGSHSTANCYTLSSMDSRAKMQTSTNVNRGSTLPTPGVAAYKSPTSAPQFRYLAMRVDVAGNLVIGPISVQSQGHPRAKTTPEFLKPQSTSFCFQYAICPPHDWPWSALASRAS